MTSALCPLCRHQLRYGKHGSGTCVTGVPRCWCGKPANFVAQDVRYCRPHAPVQAEILVIENRRSA